MGEQRRAVDPVVLFVIDGSDLSRVMNRSNLQAIYMRTNSIRVIRAEMNDRIDS